MILEEKKKVKGNIIYNSLFLADLKHFNFIKRQTHSSYATLTSKKHEYQSKRLWTLCTKNWQLPRIGDPLKSTCLWKTWSRLGYPLSLLFFYFLCLSKDYSGSFSPSFTAHTLQSSNQDLSQPVSITNRRHSRENSKRTLQPFSGTNQNLNILRIEGSD